MKAIIADLYQKMDRNLEERQTRLEEAEERGDTTTMRKLIPAGIEAGFIEALQRDKKHTKAKRGRGTPGA